MRHNAHDFPTSRAVSALWTKFSTLIAIRLVTPDMLVKLHETADPESPVVREVELAYPEEAFKVVPHTECFAVTVEYEADGPEWVANITIEEYERQHNPNELPEDDFAKENGEYLTIHHSEHHIVDTEADLLRFRQRGKKKHGGTIKKYAPEKLVENEDDEQSAEA